MSSSSLGRAENRGRRRLFSPTLPTPFFSETTKNTPTKLPTCLPHGGRREDALLRRLHSGRPGHPTPLAGVLGVFPPSVFTYKYREGQQQEKKEEGEQKEEQKKAEKEKTKKRRKTERDRKKNREEKNHREPPAPPPSSSSASSSPLFTLHVNSGEARGQTQNGWARFGPIKKIKNCNFFTFCFSTKFCLILVCIFIS